MVSIRQRERPAAWTRQRAVQEQPREPYHPRQDLVEEVVGLDPSLVPEELYPQYALGFSRLEEALNCYERAGMDALDLEMTLRRAFGFPPVECDEDEHSPWAWGDRVKVLARMPYTEYLKTPEWAEQRRRAKARAGGRCQGCADTRYLETHHVTYENRGQELPEDLTVLCAQCHTAVHLVADAKRGKVRSESRRV